MEEAKKTFGVLGERVLAFARYKLPVDKYPKNNYEFNVSTWKEWGMDPTKALSDYEKTPGSFPMHEMCLIGKFIIFKSLLLYFSNVSYRCLLSERSSKTKCRPLCEQV